MRRLFASALPVAAGFAASPAYADTEAAQSRITVVAPLTLIKSDDLQFGSILSGAAGTVTISATTGARTNTGGAIPVGAGFQRAEFAGMAQLGLITTISIPATTTLNRIGGGASMPTTLVLEGSSTRLFTGNAIQFFRVGGTLTVSANKLPGTYQGTFTMTVNYF
jgi:hypothetical protein